MEQQEWEKSIAFKQLLYSLLRDTPPDEIEFKLLDLKKGIEVSDLSDSLKTFLLWLKKTHGPIKTKLWKHEIQWAYEDEVIKRRLTGRTVKVRKKVKVPVVYDDLVLPRIGTWSKGNQASAF